MLLAMFFSISIFFLADVCKILGKMWQEATAEVRQKYNEMYVADKARYEKVSFDTWQNITT